MLWSLVWYQIYQAKGLINYWDDNVPQSPIAKQKGNKSRQTITPYMKYCLKPEFSRHRWKPSFEKGPPNWSDIVATPSLWRDFHCKPWATPLKFHRKPENPKGSEIARLPVLSWLSGAKLLLSFCVSSCSYPLLSQAAPVRLNINIFLHSCLCSRGRKHYQPLHVLENPLLFLRKGLNWYKMFFHPGVLTWQKINNSPNPNKDWSFSESCFEWNRLSHKILCQGFH